MEAQVPSEVMFGKTLAETGHSVSDDSVSNDTVCLTQHSTSS